jgi:hypothetical protein
MESWHARADLSFQLWMMAWIDLHSAEIRDRVEQVFDAWVEQIRVDWVRICRFRVQPGACPQRYSDRIGVTRSQEAC